MPTPTAPVTSRTATSVAGRPRNPRTSPRLKRVRRGVAAFSVSAGLLGAGVLPAANATSHDDYNYDYDYAWVKVCQYVEYHDRYQDYAGYYHVDSYYDYDADSDQDWDFDINGWRKCHGAIKVKVGKIKVTVDEAPEGVADDYDDSVAFRVRKDRTYTVTAYYTDSNHDDEGHQHLVLTAQDNPNR
jgi:hypothetical protein